MRHFGRQNKDSILVSTNHPSLGIAAVRHPPERQPARYKVIIKAPMASETFGAIPATTPALRLERVPSGITTPVPQPTSGHTPPSASHYGYGHEHYRYHGHNHSHSHDISQGQASTPTAILPFDPSLDHTIRALLDQQAEIEARLAALLPRKYGPNIRFELDMLRHKLRSLRAFAGDSRKHPALIFSSIYMISPQLISPPSGSLICLLVLSVHLCGEGVDTIYLGAVLSLLMLWNHRYIR